jgi:Mg2+ and Co2+ transporter CorA
MSDGLSLIDYGMTVEDVLNRQIDEIEKESLRLKCEIINMNVRFDALCGDNSNLRDMVMTLRKTVTRQRKMIKSYYKAIDGVHGSIKEVYHGE